MGDNYLLTMGCAMGDNYLLTMGCAMGDNYLLTMGCAMGATLAHCYASCSLVNLRKINCTNHGVKKIYGSSGSATINNVAPPKHPEEEETSPNRNHIIIDIQR